MFRSSRPIAFTWLIASWAAATFAQLAPSTVARVTVDAARDLAPVPRRLFGTNLRQNMEVGRRIRAFLTETGITLFRYPDSIDAGYSWDWDHGGVMTRAGKPLISSLARFDHASDLARAAGAELFFTLKIHESSPGEAARWVTEAKRRGLGGSYWCFGNEPYFKGEKSYLSPEAYADLVNAFAPAMKRADPDVHLGIGWGGPYIEEQADKGRDSFVLRATKQWVDFIDFHFYTGRWDKERGIDARRIMAGSLLVAEHTRKFRQIIAREAPEKADHIELQYWEWNGPPWPEVGGIQTLATALFAADAVGEMARCGVSAAMQYNLQEHACGLISGFAQDRADSWKSEPWNGKTVRPIAYALQLWSRHMGPVLVDCTASNWGTYHTTDWHKLVNYQGEVPLLSAHATRGEDRKSLQLLVVSRDLNNPIEADVSIAGFTPADHAEVLTLTGPSALSHNDVTDRQPVYHSFADAPEPVVKITSSQRAIPGPVFRHTFPSHSATAILLRAR